MQHFSASKNNMLCSLKNNGIVMYCCLF